MFLCIKAVIFFSYWQGVLLFVLQHAKVIKGTSTWTAEQTALAIQDFLICVEMFAISLVHPYVFGFEQFVKQHEPSLLVSSSLEPPDVEMRPVNAELAVKPILTNLKDVVHVNDLAADLAATVQPVTIGKHSKAV